MSNTVILFNWQNSKTNPLYENGKITERMRCHDVIKMEGKRIKSIVVYNSIVPEFKSIGRWLNSLNVEYERQSI